MTATDSPEVRAPTDRPPLARRTPERLSDLSRRVLSQLDWEICRLSEVEALGAEEVARRIGSECAAVRSALLRIRAQLVREIAARQDLSDRGCGRLDESPRSGSTDE